MLNEGYPRPQVVERLAGRARRAKDKLFNLDTINLGFIRPHSSDEWTLAYCQAELYAEYMLERFGDDAIAKMLAAYADNLTTPEALAALVRRVAGRFRAGLSRVRRQDRGRLAGRRARARNGAGRRAKGAGQEPATIPMLLAQLAQAQLGRRNYPEARRSADAALADRAAQRRWPTTCGPGCTCWWAKTRRRSRGSKGPSIATIRRRTCWRCWPA